MVTMTQEEVEKEKCCICQGQAKHYCSFCVDEYEFGPDIPVAFYCDKHYKSVVETGNCCYGSERVYGQFQGR